MMYAAFCYFDKHLLRGSPRLDVRPDICVQMPLRSGRPLSMIKVLLALLMIRET